MAQFQADPTEICFAVIDKRLPPSLIDPDGELAGLVACNEAFPDHRTVKISHTIMIPKFIPKSTTTNAVGLLVRHFLPSPSGGGLGLLRVEELVSAGNKASVAALTRAGFRQEGVLRWHRVMHNASHRRKIGNGRSMPDYYAEQDDVGRDTVCMSFCWEDWRDGGRETLGRLIGPEINSSKIQSKL